MITYDQMVTEVTTRLGNRQDVSTRIGRWINYAYFEILMNPRFSFLELDRYWFTPTVAGQSTINLPPDLWFVQDIRDNTNQRRIRQIHWQVIDDIQQVQGQPTRYARFQPEAVIFDPIPDNIYQIQVRYRTRVSELSSVNSPGVTLGDEWEEPLTTLSYIKGCEALELQEKAGNARTLLEGMLGMRQDVPMLEDEDSDFGLMPSIVYRQTY